MSLSELGFPAQMIEIIRTMKAYVAVLSGYQEGSIMEPDTCRISNMRNYVQHQLLSLPPAGKMGVEFRKSHPVYEMCRLAGLIFSIGVIFPLPNQTAPFRKLVSLLQAEIEYLNVMESIQASITGVVIWALTLGSIAAASRSSEKTWFTAVLGRLLTTSSEISTWRDFKQVLQRMVWLDRACDSAGQKLWDEVVESSQSGQVR
jgi:hypothetical protein